MKETINISHFINKDVFSKIQNVQKVVDNMTKSTPFKSLLKLSNKAAKINIVSIHQNQNFNSLLNRIEVFDENKNSILSAFAKFNHKTLEYEGDTFKIEDRNNTSTSKDKGFKKEDFIKLDYELTVTRKENEALKCEMKAVKEENKSLLEFKDKYKSEKRKGGKNSAKRYDVLRSKTEELCKKIMKGSKINSGRELTKKVAQELEKNHKDLLLKFYPYKTNYKEQTDWTGSNFYNWCNNIFKSFQEQA